MKNIHPVPSRASRGSILLLVLWMLILLGVVGLSYTASVRTQVRALHATRGKTEAIWAARAGVERARVALAAATLETLRDTDPLMNDAASFGDQPVGHATFSLVKPQTDPAAAPEIGLLDEASRLNINAAGRRMLGLIPGIDEGLVDTLLDWRDGDDTPRPMGAEADYYLSLENPYKPRNGALHDLRELLRVKGWEPIYREVYPDPYDRFSTEANKKEPPIMAPLDAQRMMNMITVWSMDDGKAPDGKDKMDLGSVKASDMQERVPGISQDEANAIEKWRGNNNKYANATDLLKVTKPKQENGNNANSKGGNRNRNNNNNNNRGNNNSNNNNRSGGGNNNRGGANRGGSGNQASGDLMFTMARVGEIIDYFKAGNADQDPATSGKININTASRDVLMLIPGITDRIADAIVAGRAAQAYAGAGALASVSGIDQDTFTRIYRRFTARSYRFHVWSRGTEPDSGATFTAEAVLARDATDVSIIYWREY